ncbi:MAG: hypothetical protein AB1502_00080 [Thermodesulfobacteriota bacterium]
MDLPKRLIVEYEDGSTKAVEFKELSPQARIELSRSGLCPPPSEPEVSKHYILLQWKDGWKEVVRIDKKAPELLRYYTVERVEEVGRMALESGEDYPVLFLVKRLPRQIETLLIVGPTRVEGYTLEEKRTVKEGNKIEHILYDKKDSYPRQRNEGWVAELKERLKAELKKKGLTAEKLLSLDETQKVQAYREISKALGLRGMEKQEDVYGFMQLMTEGLLALKQ